MIFLQLKLFEHSTQKKIRNEVVVLVCVKKSPNDGKKYEIIYCWAILSPSWSIIADNESPFCILSRLTTCVFELARNSSSFPGSRNDFTNEVISSVTSVFGLESIL